MALPGSSARKGLPARQSAQQYPEVQAAAQGEKQTGSEQSAPGPSAAPFAIAEAMRGWLMRTGRQPAPPAAGKRTSRGQTWPEERMRIRPTRAAGKRNCSSVTASAPTLNTAASSMPQRRPRTKPPSRIDRARPNLLRIPMRIRAKVPLILRNGKAAAYQCIIVPVPSVSWRLKRFLRQDNPDQPPLFPFIAVSSICRSRAILP